MNNREITATWKTQTGWKIICLMLVVLTWTTVAHAAENSESVASVVALRGSATALNSQGDKRPLSLHSPLYPDDTISTDKSGRLRILFIDNSIVSLGSSSTAKIAEYAWNKETGEAKLKTKISEGVFRIMGGLITKEAPENFTVETPAGTIGIRGSMFAGTISPQGLTLIFEGGKGITLTNDTGTVAITEMGHGISIAKRHSPLSRPAMTPRHTVKMMRQQLAGKPSPAEQPVLRQEFTSWVKNKPARAAEVLKTAVANEQLSTENALSSVLQGLQNIDRESFDSLIDQAIDMGLTMEGTKKVVEEFKNSGGVCN